MGKPCQGSEVNDCDQAACNADKPRPLTTWQPCLEFPFHPQTPKDGVCGDYCLHVTDEETWARGG